MVSKKNPGKWSGGKYIVKGKKFKSKKAYFDSLKAIHAQNNKPGKHRRKAKSKLKNKKDIPGYLLPDIDIKTKEGRKEYNRRASLVERKTRARKPAYYELDLELSNKYTGDIQSKYVVDGYLSNSGGVDVLGIDEKLDDSRLRKARLEKIQNNEELIKRLEEEEKIPYRKSEKHRTESREKMNDNKQYYKEFLDQLQQEKLPKDSKLRFLEIASLQSRIREGSSDWKSDSIYDDLDLSLSYEENLDIINQKYPKLDEKEMKSLELAHKRDENQDFIENYYMSKAEENPTKAIKDSNQAENVKKIPTGDINKKWLENPFTKSGGDYEGIDDGTNPYSKEDFSNEAFQDESLRDFSRKKKPGKNKNTSNEKDLLSQANKLLESSDSGYFYPSQRSLIKGAIEKKEYDYIKEQLPKWKSKLANQKKEIQERDKKNKIQDTKTRDIIHKGKTKDQLIRELVRKEIKQEELNKKFSQLKSNNPGDRTQRKAKLNNNLDGTAREIQQLKDSIREYQDKDKFTRYMKITDRIHVLNNRINEVEMSIPPRSEYEDRKPFIKKWKPLQKEKDILLLEQVKLEKPYLKKVNGKERFDFARFVKENKKSSYRQFLHSIDE